MIDERNDYVVSKTLINKQECEIWARSETHDYGKNNGESGNLWVRYNDNWEPWLDKCAHRPCWGFRIDEGHYTKHKWGELQINGTCYGAITCNGRDVYEIRCRDISYAFAKAQSLIVELSEHPFDFVFPEKMIGRKVWYKDQPAKIGEHIMLDQGCIMLIYDGDIGAFQTKKPWHGEDDKWCYEESHGAKEIKDEILSPSILWFRD